jgi:hypothetical protein
LKEIMAATVENDDIVAAVAELRSRFDIPVDPRRRGPVPLARFLEEFNLLHVSLPRLTRGVMVEHLLREGILPGDLIGTSDPSEVLAGFLFATSTDGFVFIGEQEQAASADGEPAKFRQTPLGRRRFTVGHELGHFCLHRGQMDGRVLIGDTPATVTEVMEEGLSAMEREANRFAVELLMPKEVCFARADEFRRAYRVCPRTPFAYYLAAELLVSSQAMRYRLTELEVGDE